MNTLQRSLLVLLGLAGAASPMIPALAAPPPNVFKDSAGNVYIHGTLAAGLNDNSRATTSTSLVRNVRAGYCGEVRIAPSSALPSIGDLWQVGSVSINRSGLPIITDDAQLPNCRNATWTPTLTAAITTAGGFVDDTPGGNGRVTFLGQTPGVNVAITYNDIGTSINLRRNQCGFVRINANSAPQSFTINGTAYTTAGLTVATAPLCRETQDNVYETFSPSSWN